MLMGEGWKDSIYKAAQKHGADPERAWVWETFSQVYLDASHSDQELQDMAIELAGSRFSTAELAHIAFYEVNPICIWNVFYWEWGGFDTDWLFPRCLKQQRKNPYKASSTPDDIPLFLTILAGIWLDASRLVDRARRIRMTRKAAQ